MTTVFNMRYVLVFFVACLISSFSYADDVTLDWNAPTSTVGGDPLGAGDIAGYEVVYTDSSGLESTILINENVTTVTIPDLVGNYTFLVSAIGANGLRGNASDPLSLSFGDVPESPSDLTGSGTARTIGDRVDDCLAQPNCKIHVSLDLP